MQASQSSNASNLMTPETAPDQAFPFSFPSPFSAPIQAARKYFERQKGDNWQAGARETDAQIATAYQVEEPIAQNPGTQTPNSRNQSSREQDRRLERSLYGHSLEAALSFDGPQAEEASGASGAEGAYFTDSDGSDALFPYADPGPLPDPAAVRGAILRLARESELRGVTVPAAATASGTPLADSGAVAATTSERKTSVQEASVQETSLRESSNQEMAVERPVPPLAFGDVARRVWGADYPQFVSRPHTEPDQHPTPQSPLNQPAASAAPAAIGRDDSAAQLRPEPLRPEEATRTPAFADDAAVDAGSSASPARSGIHLQPAGIYAASSSVTALSQDAVREPPYKTAEDSSPKPGSLPEALAPAPAKAGPAPAGPAAGVAQEEPALAHDACNLLSALSLYGELLASPGVLAREHRHYAEELKLMAGRSQVLIDRLLRVAAARKAQGRPFGTQSSGAPNAEAGQAISASGNEAPSADQRVGPSEAVSRENVAPSMRDAAGIACGFADAEQPAAAEEAGIHQGEAVHAAGKTSPAASAAEQGDTREIIPAVAAAESVLPAIPARPAEEAPATSLVYLLMRWGSLLSTLAHGTLEVRFGPHAATPVPAGAEALERILVNLVRNARAATAMGGAIRIGVGVAEVGAYPVSEAGASALSADAFDVAASVPAPSRAAHLQGTMVLTVDDSGCGMSEAQVRRILDEAGGPEETLLAARAADFVYNASDGRRQGLGLQIVRQLVGASGGTISIQSWPGRGTRVEIRWPVEIQPAVGALEAVPDRAVEVHQAEASALETAPAAGEVGEAATAAPVAGSWTEAPTVDLAVAAPVNDASQPTISAASGPPPKLFDRPSMQQPVRPAIEPAVRYALAESPDPPSRGLSAEGETVGPDGFSEAELRAMMLRLHRTGPSGRGPLSRRLDRRPWDARLAAVRQVDLRPRSRADGDHGDGVFGSSVPASRVSASVASGLGTNAAGWGHLAQSTLAHEDENAKGAIAC